MFPWIIASILGIVILFLLNRPPKVIEKNYDEEYRLKLENEYNKKISEYEKIKSEKLSKLKETISEEKENSINKIHSYEKEAMKEIDKSKNEKYLELEQQYQKWKIEQEEKYEEFLNQQEELKKLKENEIKEKIEKIYEETEEVVKENNWEIEQIKNEIESWRSKYDAAIEAYKKLDKERQAEDFYRIKFSEVETEELEELNKVIRKLKNPMPFYKAVYDIYYKHKVSDLTKRVVGKDQIAGVYKITHIESGKCYVGQSVNIANRWKQHIKRGVGADKITQNKLYPAMMELGITNFTFEIIETTEDTDKLNDMEKYWQEFLGAKEFGYSVK